MPTLPGVNCTGCVCNTLLLLADCDSLNSRALSCMHCDDIYIYMYIVIKIYRYIFSRSGCSVNVVRQRGSKHQDQYVVSSHRN